jgi:hypothetical protein
MIPHQAVSRRINMLGQSTSESGMWHLGTIRHDRIPLYASTHCQTGVTHGSVRAPAALS